MYDNRGIKQKQIKPTQTYKENLNGNNGKTHTLWNRGQGFGIWRDEVWDLMGKKHYSTKINSQHHETVNVMPWS